MDRPQKIANISKQSRKYFRIANWLLRDTYFRPPFQRPLIILILSSLRLLCQVSGVAILYYYANALKDGNIFTLYGLSYAARESFVLMWIIIITSSLLFILMSVCQYFSRTVAIAMACHYEEIFSRRAFNIVSRLPDPRVPNLNELILQNDILKIGSDARRAGMTVRIIGYGVPQMISGVIALGSIIIIDPVLTLLIGSMMGLVFLGQYPANLRGAKFSDVFEKTVQQASRASTKLIRKMVSSQESESAKSDRIALLYSEHGLKKAIHAFGSRLKVIEESTLITQIGSAIVLSVAVFSIGSRLLNGNANWGLLLIYLAALRATLTGIVSIGRLMTNVSRFYPQLVRFHHLLSGEALLAKKPSDLGTGDIIRLKNPGSKTIDSVMNFRTPQKIALFTPDSIDPSLLHIFNHATITSPGQSPRPFDCLPTIVSSATFVPPKEMRPSNSSDVCILAHDLIEKCPSRIRSDLLQKQLTIIVYDNLQRSPQFNETLLLIWLDFKLAWGGHNTTNHLREIQNRFGPFFEKDRKRTHPDDLTTAEEFEDDGF